MMQKDTKGEPRGDKVIRVARWGAGKGRLARIESSTCHTSPLCLPPCSFFCNNGHWRFCGHCLQPGPDVRREWLRSFLSVNWQSLCSFPILPIIPGCPNQWNIIWRTQNPSEASSSLVDVFLWCICSEGPKRPGSSHPSHLLVYRSHQWRIPISMGLDSVYANGTHLLNEWTLGSTTSLYQPFLKLKMFNYYWATWNSSSRILMGVLPNCIYKCIPTVTHSSHPPDTRIMHLRQHAIHTHTHTHTHHQLQS
jgi:hypothetical protein